MMGSAGMEVFPCNQGHYRHIVLCSFSIDRLHLLRPGSHREAHVTDSTDISWRALHAASGAGPAAVNQPAELWCSRTHLPTLPG